jgi:hypothetical protein
MIRTALSLAADLINVTTGIGDLESTKRVCTLEINSCKTEPSASLGSVGDEMICAVFVGRVVDSRSTVCSPKGVVEPVKTTTR